MIVVGNINNQVQEKAKGVLVKMKKGTLRPIKHNASGYLCLRVGYRYRLLKRNSHWELMSHEKYNQFTSKKKKLCTR